MSCGSCCELILCHGASNVHPASQRCERLTMIGAFTFCGKQSVCFSFQDALERFESILRISSGHWVLRQSNIAIWQPAFLFEGVCGWFNAFLMREGVFLLTKLRMCGSKCVCWYFLRPCKVFSCSALSRAAFSDRGDVVVAQLRCV